MKTSLLNDLHSSNPDFARSDSTPAVVGEIEQFLQDTIAQLTPDLEDDRQDVRGRPRILPSMCLWAGLLVCVLRGFHSQLALWRLISKRQLWFYPRFPVSDQAVYKRLQAEGTATMERLFEHISMVLRQRLVPFADIDLAPFAKEVVALDQSHLDKVARTLPALRGVPPGDDRLLPGVLGCLFDLRLQQWRRVAYHSEPRQNEKLAARELVEGLPPGSLVLADLGYFGFAWFDALTDQGYFWVSRVRAKTSYKIIQVFYQQGQVFDGLVFLGAYRADRAAHAVRLVQFEVGSTTYRYISNVLDPRLLPIPEIARLYARRWDIELAFKLVKTQLGLHLLWSAKTVVIMQQVWAVLIISQVLGAMRLEIAGRAGVDIFEVSLPLLVQYLPQYAYSGDDPVAAFVEQGRFLRFIHPSRRTQIQAPDPPWEQMTPLPPELVLVRQARYAGRNSGPRSAKKN